MSSTQTLRPGGARRARALLFAGGAVFGVFTLLDLAIVISPPVGRRLVDHSTALLIVGALCATALLVAAYASRVTALGRATGPGLVTTVLEEMPGTSVVHALKTRRGLIEHAVVADGGVFVVAARSPRGKINLESGRLTVAGKPYERETLGRLHVQAKYLEAKIEAILRSKVPVRPVMVLTRAKPDLRAVVAGVTVTTVERLPEVVQRARTCIGPQEMTVVRTLLEGDLSAILKSHPDLEAPASLFDRRRERAPQP